MVKIVSKDFWITTFLPFSAAMAASGTLIPLFIISGIIGGDVSDIGMLSALSSLISLPLAFAWGKLTDDTGKRRIFILIAFISGFGILLGYSFASNLTWLIILSIMSGLLLGAGDTAKTMYIFDTYPPDLWEEKISKYQQRTGIGACSGLVFGALFQIFYTFPNSFMIFFLICAVLSAISAILGYLIIKDISKEKIQFKIERTPILNLDLPSYSSLFQPRKLISYEIKPSEKDTPTKSQITSTLIMFFLGGFSLYLASNLTFTPLPAFITGLSIESSFVFWIFLSYYAVSVVGYTFAGNWIDRMGNRKVLFIGILIRMVVYATFTIFALLAFYGMFAGATTSSFIIIIILLIFGGMSYSLMNVSLQNTLPRLVQRNIGEVLAIYSIIIGSSAILGSFFSGFIAETLGYHWLFLFSVIFSGIAFAIYLKSVKKNIP